MFDNDFSSYPFSTAINVVTGAVNTGAQGFWYQKLIIFGVL